MYPAETNDKSGCHLHTHIESISTRSHGKRQNIYINDLPSSVHHSKLESNNLRKTYMTINFLNETITPVSFAKDLGMTIDSYLTYDQHITNLVSS
ncbi:Hypothetical predicted protein, partial [Paramuricea clavata]